MEKKITKYLVVSDSFKGTLTSKEVGSTITETLKEMGYIADYIPISDGGEGFLDAIYEKNSDLLRLSIECEDALGRMKKAHFLYDEYQNKAYFELAEAVGIKDLKEDELNVSLASTYGLGELIFKAISNYDISDIYVGIGGSASNDGGAGMLEALGLIFLDQNGNKIHNLNNKKLADVYDIDDTILKQNIKGLSFTILSDVTNPLLGKCGATNVYAPQKGAKVSDLIMLEQNLKHFAEVTNKLMNCDKTNILGAGAAGGVGFGMLSYLNAKILSGIDVILNLNNFGLKVKEYDEIITGEGAIDDQSLSGKVISGILKYDIKKLSIVCGISKLDNFKYPIYSIVPNICNKEESLAHPKEALIKLIKNNFK